MEIERVKDKVRREMKSFECVNRKIAAEEYQFSNFIQSQIGPPAVLIEKTPFHLIH